MPLLASPQGGVAEGGNNILTRAGQGSFEIGRILHLKSEISIRTDALSLLRMTFPATAKGFDQMDAGGHIQVDGLRQRQLIG